MAIQNKGLPTSKSIPYLGRDSHECQKNVSFISQAAIKSFKSFSMYSENKIACMLAANGPISIALFISKSFIQYSSGIYNDLENCSPNADPNHSILLGSINYIIIATFLFKKLTI